MKHKVSQFMSNSEALSRYGMRGIDSYDHSSPVLTMHQTGNLPAEWLVSKFRACQLGKILNRDGRSFDVCRLE